MIVGGAFWSNWQPLPVAVKLTLIAQPFRRHDGQNHSTRTRRGPLYGSHRRRARGVGLSIITSGERQQIGRASCRERRAATVAAASATRKREEGCVHPCGK